MNNSAQNTPDQAGRGQRFLRYHLPVILYAAAIVVVSSIRDLRPPPTGISEIDKVAHFLEYAVFSWLTFRSFYHLGKTPNLRRTLLLSALFVSIFALLDEIYQYFIPGRHSDWADFVVDVAGALVILAGLALFRSVRKRSSYHDCT